MKLAIGEVTGLVFAVYFVSLNSVANNCTGEETLFELLFLCKNGK